MIYATRGRRIALIAMLLVAAHAPARSQQGGLDGPSGPRVASVGLGDSMSLVIATLGHPDGRREYLGFREWQYSRRGITLMWNRGDEELHVIVLRKREAGDVYGVRVHDSVAVVASRLGVPTRSRQTGRFLDFVRPKWAISLEIVRGAIVEITLIALDSS